MADDEHGRPLPSIYDGLPDRRPTDHPDADLTKSEKREKIWTTYRNQHPKKKVTGDFVGWLMFVGMYYYLKDTGDAHGRYWAAIVVGASTLWMLTPYRLYQWWRLKQNENDKS